MNENKLNKGNQKNHSTDLNAQMQNLYIELYLRGRNDLHNQIVR